MELVNVQGVTKDYGHRRVLSGVSLNINSGQKLGLIGANGAGKTSILRLITGEELPTEGVITKAGSLRIGHVTQQVAYDESQTVLEWVLAEHAKAEGSLHERAERLARASTDEVPGELRAYEAAREAYERAGGDTLRARAMAVLDSLGLAGRGDQLVGPLSGGEKNVLSLTQALLASPELLLLDEPDNHLDFAGLAWLERFLAGFQGAVLIVSHNRYLLDRVVDGILHPHPLAHERHLAEDAARPNAGGDQLLPVLVLSVEVDAARPEPCSSFMKVNTGRGRRVGTRRTCGRCPADGAGRGTLKRRRNRRSGRRSL